MPRSALELSGFRDPSQPHDVAADTCATRQLNSQSLGFMTGAPPRTLLSQVLVIPIVNGAGVLQVPTMIVPATRENRFVTLTAPLILFSVYVNGEANFSTLSALSLPPGTAYEISLPGNQALYAVTDSPVFVSLRVQIASALAGDTERRL
jgi:hypothetical protein